MKNNIVGLKELRLNIQKYVSFVEAGQTFVIVKKSKPIFKIVPAESEGQWETVANFTTINKDGVPAQKILKELHKLNAAMKSLINSKI